MVTSAAPIELRVLVPSVRPAVDAFLRGLGLEVVEYDAVRRATASFGPSLAVVDVGAGSAAAVDLCRALRLEQPNLPILGVVCCSYALTPWDLRGLLAAGVGSLLDLSASREEARAAFHGAARGETVLHLRLGRAGRWLLHDVLNASETRTQTQVALLELVALGLPDHEIGRRLHLSPHTVKHHIEQLRADVGVRNRTELAAWAGRHGFYSPDERAPR
jgi:DNA-binding NarL/FixJ family response regulator